MRSDSLLPSEKGSEEAVPYRAGPTPNHAGANRAEHWHATHQNVRRLTIRGQADFESGYGHLFTHTILNLQRHGIYVAIRATGVHETIPGTIPKQIRGAFVSQIQPEPWELLIYPPTLPKSPGKKTIIWTMWEATILPSQNVHFLNECELVIVPCEWCKVCFEKSGVRKPIVVIPLGVDPKIFVPSPVNTHGPTIFGIAGRVKHCPERKGIQAAIDLFIKAFPHDESVRLHVRIAPDDPIKIPSDNRIKLSRTLGEPYELAQWINGLTVFLSLARSEGFGLWQAQSLASGRPLVAMKYSGVADFLTTENGYPLPYREIECEGVGNSNVKYTGEWAEPHLAAAIRILQEIARDRTTVISKGFAASKSMEKYTWENSTDKLIAVLEEVGVWK